LFDVEVLDDVLRTLLEDGEQPGEDAAEHVGLDFFVSVDVEAGDQQAVVDAVDLFGEVFGDAEVVFEGLFFPVAELPVGVDFEVEQHDSEAGQTDVFGVVVVAQPLFEVDSGEVRLLVFFESAVELHEDRSSVCQFL